MIVLKPQQYQQQQGQIRRHVGKEYPQIPEAAEQAVSIQGIIPTIVVTAIASIAARDVTIVTVAVVNATAIMMVEVITELKYYC